MTREELGIPMPSDAHKETRARQTGKTVDQLDQEMRDAGFDPETGEPMPSNLKCDACDEPVDTLIELEYTEEDGKKAVAMVGPCCAPEPEPEPKKGDDWWPAQQL